MKKGVLIILGIFMMVSTVEAKIGKIKHNNIGVNYSYDNAVNFVERNIEFFVFTNGEFDFNTNYSNVYYGHRSTNRGVRISRDFRGRINRIGNVYVNYDFYGNVTRIGNVFMRYHRGRLTKVGNLNVEYDRWGNSNYYGNVKRYNSGINFNINFGDVCDFDDAYFYRNDFRVNYSKIREDNNYYYYRARPNAKIGKHSKVLRRRKQVSTYSNRKTTQDTRRSNNSYRKPATVNYKRGINSTNYRKSASATPTRKTVQNTRKSSNSYRKPASVISKRGKNTTTYRKGNSSSTKSKQTTRKIRSRN